MSSRLLDDVLANRTESLTPQGIREIAAEEAAKYHAFMVEKGESELLDWDLLEIAFYSGFCKSFNYTVAWLKQGGGQ